LSSSLWFRLRSGRRACWPNWGFVHRRLACRRRWGRRPSIGPDQARCRGCFQRLRRRQVVPINRSWRCRFRWPFYCCILFLDKISCCCLFHHDTIRVGYYWNFLSRLASRCRRTALWNRRRCTRFVFLHNQLLLKARPVHGRRHWL
jgi:hypothetical protein